MNEHEARLKISTLISDVLFDLAKEGLEADENPDDYRDAMDDTAELVMEALGLEVVSTDDGVVVRLTNVNDA